MEARIGSDALLVVIPDPVTCFSTARYSQKQVFRMVNNSSLLIVDWITSGRHESGEKWDFGHYKSTNHIYLDTNLVFLDTVLLEKISVSSIAEQMKDYILWLIEFGFIGMLSVSLITDIHVHLLSTRGYVAKMCERDGNNHIPFADVSGEELPPIQVPRLDIGFVKAVCKIILKRLH